MTEPPIDSVAGLLAHAHRMEAEAQACYEDLARRMDAHRRPELAEFFRKMALIEQKHIDQVSEMVDALELPSLDDAAVTWMAGDAPESMSANAMALEGPREALKEAMRAEEQAVAFFEDVAVHTPDQSVRAMATELAAEERHHVALLRNWLARVSAAEDEQAQ